MVLLRPCARPGHHKDSEPPSERAREERIEECDNHANHPLFGMR